MRPFVIKTSALGKRCVPETTLALWSVSMFLFLLSINLYFGTEEMALQLRAFITLIEDPS